MTTLVQLNSSQDASVNFILPNGQETRYVRRSDDYFIIYVSSHNGCNQACRFCHLTQTKQTSFEPATIEQMVEQVTTVMQYYVDEVTKGKQPPAAKLHINWMARGEPLLNPFITTQWKMLAAALTDAVEKTIQASYQSLPVPQIKFKISTIIPETVNLSSITFDCMFNKKITPQFYYSLYSVDPVFRKRWLPKAINPVKALSMLKTFQDATKANITLHWAFIDKENDSKQTCSDITELVKRIGIVAKFNAVRYNPYSDDQGIETSEVNLQERFIQISRVMKAPGSKIVPRVGSDVFASCGTFVPASVIP